MKKLYLVLIVIFVLIIGSITLVLINKDHKFNLEEIHYNTEERFISIKSDKLEKLMNDKKSFIVFTYLPYCTFSIPCDVIFKTFLNENNMSFYEIPYDEFSKVKKLSSIKYAPSIVLVNKGKIVTYLDANSDEDLKKYQDSKEFGNWIKKYINIK